MVQDRLVTICWESAILLAFLFVLFYDHVIIIVCDHFPFGVRGRMWNSIIPVPGQCLSSTLCKDSEFGFTSCMTEKAVKATVK